MQCAIIVAANRTGGVSRNSSLKGKTMPSVNNVNKIYAVNDKDRIARLKEAISNHYIKLGSPRLSGIAKSELDALLAGTNTNFLDNDPVLRKVVLELCEKYGVEVSYKEPKQRSA